MQKCNWVSKGCRVNSELSIKTSCDLLKKARLEYLIFISYVRFKRKFVLVLN
jgi:hypothetical protein